MATTVVPPAAPQAVWSITAPMPVVEKPAAQPRPLPPMEAHRGIRGRLDDLSDSDWFDGRLLLIVAVVGLAIGLIVTILLVSLG
jgi:hypothetical protein